MIKTLAILSTVAMGVLACSPGYADAAPPEGQVCPEWSTGHIPGDGPTVSFTAPEGQVILNLCIKAGSANQGLGPEFFEDEVSGASAIGDFIHSSGKDVSHFSVLLSDPEPPFDHNWQYEAPTCESLLVDYPDNLPHPQNANDVNIRISFDGIGTRTLNWHTSGSWAPSSTFVFADHPNWPADATVWTVEWVQVAETNYHWQGSLECGETPPPPPPVDPVVDGTLSIECVLDNEYEVSWWAESDQDFTYVVRIRDGGGKITDGSHVAGGIGNNEYVNLTEGDIVVLRINGDRVKSVMVPAACPEPVEPPTPPAPPAPPTPDPQPEPQPEPPAPEPQPEPQPEVEVSIPVEVPVEEPAVLPHTGVNRDWVISLSIILLFFGSLFMVVSRIK